MTVQARDAEEEEHGRVVQVFRFQIICRRVSISENVVTNFIILSFSMSLHNIPIARVGYCINVVVYLQYFLLIITRIQTMKNEYIVFHLGAGLCNQPDIGQRKHGIQGKYADR